MAAKVTTLEDISNRLAARRNGLDALDPKDATALNTSVMSPAAMHAASVLKAQHNHVSNGTQRSASSIQGLDKHSKVDVLTKENVTKEAAENTRAAPKPLEPGKGVV